MSATKTRHREPPPPAADPTAFRAVVEGRRAVRKFRDTPIPESVLRECLELALLAPNSSNLQPWEFVVVKDPTVRTQVAQACMNQNAARTAPVLVLALARTGTWRKHAKAVLDSWPSGSPPKLVRDYYSKLAHYHYSVGPLGSFGLLKRLIHGVAGLKRAVPRGPYTPSDVKLWATKTCALACENLMLAARANGFDSCPLEGFDEACLRRLIPMAADASVVMVIALGERAEDGVYYARQRVPASSVVREI